ncbi:hypothetical protein ACROYT_G014569 [Oculina patagonica]
MRLATLNEAWKTHLLWAFYQDQAKQDALSQLDEKTIIETHPTVSKAVLRSDNAGCYHSTSLLTTINSSSKRTGVEVIRYDFSDPQAGKNLCDCKIAPFKQRLRNYVAENNDVQTAEDVEKGLESPPGDLYDDDCDSDDDSDDEDEDRIVFETGNDGIIVSE